MTQIAADLVSPDGSVTVPADTTGELLQVLVFAFTERARTTGAQPSPAALRLLQALYDGRQRHEHGGAPPDTLPAAPGRSVSEVAAEMGCSRQYVRKLLADGRLAGRRTGGVWIVYTGHVVADPQPRQRGSATLITATERQARKAG